MIRVSRHVVTSFVVASVSSLLSACSSGGAPPAPNALPQTARANVQSIGSLGVEHGMSRIAASELHHKIARAGKHARDFATPSNTTTADPPVQRPNETPCTVTLFSNFQFTNFNYPTFTYNTPSACPGPWAKVVFEGDFSVTPGVQFDRSGSVWIAGTNVFFGTTAEPSTNVGPHWHVERDVTDLSAILTAPSQGEVVLGNIVNSTYTGVISGSGTLQFYPANTANPAATVADDVYPLSGGPLGDNQYIHSQDQPLTGTFTLPPNVEAAYLDVYLQSQIGDEFWYTCFPSDLAAQIPNCGNTAFREGDVAIDGQPAGVVPVYPWIYTGGIDPGLWVPIPGVETLEFKPYRVDLTPFASVLSNGNPHTITVNVFNNGNYYAANGTLYVFLDHGSSQVTGAVLSDSTSLYPSPNVSENVSFNSKGIGNGSVSVTSSHPVSISGYINTSQGRIQTTVQQQISFSNQQEIKGNTTGTLFDQRIEQLTSIASSTTTSGPGFTREATARKSWPLKLDYDFVVNVDGSASQFASVSQGKVERTTMQTNGGRLASTSLSDTVNSSDSVTYPTTGGFIPSGGQSTQTYSASDSSGYCYSKTIASQNYLLTASRGGACY